MLRLRSRVGPKGQAVIPKPIRDEVGIGPGDELYFRIENGTILVEKKGRNDILQEYLGASPKKRRAPKRVDWDRLYASQFRHRGR